MLHIKYGGVDACRRNSHLLAAVECALDKMACVKRPRVCQSELQLTTKANCLKLTLTLEILDDILDFLYSSYS